jgi:hypothetical protein
LRWTCRTSPPACGGWPRPVEGRAQNSLDAFRVETSSLHGSLVAGPSSVPALRRELPVPRKTAKSIIRATEAEHAVARQRTGRKFSRGPAGTSPEQDVRGVPHVRDPGPPKFPMKMSCAESWRIPGGTVSPVLR